MVERKREESLSECHYVLSINQTNIVVYLKTITMNVTVI